MGFTTQLLHSDRRYGVEHGNLLKPIHPGVTYGYEDAHDLARVFQGKQKGYTYGRQINPTVEALQQKITQMEDGLATVAFSTGMAAIGTTLFALLRSGIMSLLQSTCLAIPPVCSNRLQSMAFRFLSLTQRAPRALPRRFSPIQNWSLSKPSQIQEPKFRILWGLARSAMPTV